MLKMIRTVVEKGIVMTKGRVIVRGSVVVKERVTVKGTVTMIVKEIGAVIEVVTAVAIDIGPARCHKYVVLCHHAWVMCPGWLGLRLPC